MSSSSYQIALVTGAAGFLGRYLAKELSQNGWTVLGIGHSSWKHEEWKQWGITSWFVGDITFSTLCDACSNNVVDAIFHCAGGASVVNSLHAPHEDFIKTVGTM